MKRRMSQALAIRSTYTPSLVTHIAPRGRGTAASREAVEKSRLARRGLPPFRDDLPHLPLEVFHCFFRPGEHIDGILDGDRPEPLQSPPHLDAEVVRLGRDLVDQEYPPRWVRW